MSTRTHQEMAQVINGMSKGLFSVMSAGHMSKNENLHWFLLTTYDVLYFTPEDSDQTIKEGLMNHDLIKALCYAFDPTSIHQ